LVKTGPRPVETRQKAAVILLGGETLLGHEIQEAIERRSDPPDIAAYAASGEGGFAGEDGEAVYLAPLDAATARGKKAIVVAGSPQGAAKAYGLAKGNKGKPPLIDCSGQLEQQPEARIVSPLLALPNKASGWLLVLAHPAAAAVTLVLSKLARYQPVVRAAVHVFEPASELGKPGVAELHQQTTSLLAFKTLEKKFFDAQLAFNLLSQRGEDAPVKLATAEQRIERHVASLLAGQTTASRVSALPSLRVIQAPVFHGYSLSFWVEFERNAEAAALDEALAGTQIEVRGPSDEPPTSLEAVSQSGLIAGDIRIDSNNSRAAWLWVVFDNLRLTAEAAADTLGTLL
jgi:aspartate-semialdehyde dehydrogenase